MIDLNPNSPCYDYLIILHSLFSGLPIIINGLTFMYDCEYQSIGVMMDEKTIMFPSIEINTFLSMCKTITKEELSLLTTKLIMMGYNIK